MSSALEAEKTIDGEITDHQAMAATLTSRLSALEAEAASFRRAGNPNPSEIWRIGQIADEIATLRVSIEKGETYLRKLKYDRAMALEPLARSEADAALPAAIAENAAVESLIRDCASKILKAAKKAHAAAAKANALHAKAERLSGATMVFDRVSFSEQTMAVLHALYAHSASSHEWERRNASATPLPFDDSSLHG